MRDPNTQGSVANHLRFKPPAERKLIPGADEYVEFEMLSREHEVPSQQPLRISMGPVRSDKQTGQKEFVRVDMGQCIQTIATDVIEDARGGQQRLVQHRWWMCIETLRLLCNVDHIDCAALDKPGVPPQEWVIRLMDTHAPINRKEAMQQRPEERDIDALMDFIDNQGQGKGFSDPVIALPSAPQRQTRGRKKKGAREKDHAAASPQDFVNAAAFISVSGRQGEVRPSPTVLLDDAEEDILVASSPTIASAVSTASSPSNALPSTQSALADSADADLMGELLSRYRRLQETSGRLETDAKVAVVRELLEVLDELEHADAEMEEDSVASRVIFSAARKFEAKLRGLGLSRVEALGKPFNVSLHRAVGDVPQECETQVVVEVLESGWVLGEDIVRLALVTLG